ncbi:hypothetical protein D3C85_1872720 [compost metagenome]
MQLQAIMRSYKGGLTKGLIVMGSHGTMKQIHLAPVIAGAEFIALVPMDARVPEEMLVSSGQGSLL